MPSDVKNQPQTEDSKASAGTQRAAALIALPVGALGSVSLMLVVGHRNESRILLALFTLWVLSPFAALATGLVRSRRWSDLARATLYWVTLVVAAGSLLLYGEVALGAPRAKPAFMFLVVPLASWLLIALAVPIAAASRHQH